MVHCQGNLKIHSPNDASEHCCTNSSHVSSLAIGSECLIIEDDDVKEEDDKGGIETVAHPSQYSIPVKEQIFGSLLVKCRELQKARSASRECRVYQNLDEIQLRHFKGTNLQADF